MTAEITREEALDALIAWVGGDCNEWTAEDLHVFGETDRRAFTVYRGGEPPVSEHAYSTTFSRKTAQQFAGTTRTLMTWRVEPGVAYVDVPANLPEHFDEFSGPGVLVDTAAEDEIIILPGAIYTYDEAEDLWVVTPEASRAGRSPAPTH